MDETNNPRAIYEEDAGHLSNISNRSTCRISCSPGSNPMPPHSRAENLKDRAGPQAVSRICLPFGIGETGERYILFTTESARLLYISLTDEHDLGSLRLESFIVASQPGDVLSTERSAEVARENEDDRAIGPERGEADAVTVAANQLDVWSPVPNSEHSPPSHRESHSIWLPSTRGRDRRHPFTTPIGRSRATRRAIPAASTTRATSFTSL